MIGFLRCVGLLNAGVWFGAAVFFTFSIGPAVFSSGMQNVLKEGFPYYSGLIAQILISRYFHLQIICALVALIHFWGEHLYFGRSPRTLWLSLLLALFALALFGNFWLQPKLKDLHALKYSQAARPESRDAAAQSFRVWHGASQVANLLALAGLALHLWLVSSPSETMRFLNPGKIRS